MKNRPIISLGHAHLRDQRDIEEHRRRQNQQAKRADGHGIRLAQDHAVQPRVDAARRQRAVVLQLKAIVLHGDNAGDRRFERGQHIVRQRREDRLDLPAQRAVCVVRLGRQAIHRLRRDKAGQINRLFFHRQVVLGRVVRRSRRVVRRGALRGLRRIRRLRARFFGEIRPLCGEQHVERRAHRLGVDFSQIHRADAELLGLRAGFLLCLGRRLAHGGHAAAALARLALEASDLAAATYASTAPLPAVLRMACRRIFSSTCAPLPEPARVQAVQADDAHHNRQRGDHRRRNHLRAGCPQLSHAPRLPSS